MTNEMKKRFNKEVTAMAVDYDELQTEQTKLLQELEEKQVLIEKYRMLNNDITITQSMFETIENSDLFDFNYSNKKINAETFIQDLKELMNRESKALVKNQYALNEKDTDMMYATEPEITMFLERYYRVIMELSYKYSYEKQERLIAILVYIDKYIKVDHYFHINDLLKLFVFDNEEIKSLLFLLFVSGDLKMFKKGDNIFFMKTDKSIINNTYAYKNREKLYQPEKDEFGRIRSKYFLNAGEDKLFTELLNELKVKFSDSECFTEEHIFDGDAELFEDNKDFIETLIVNNYIKQVFITKDDYCYIKTGKLIVEDI